MVNVINGVWKVPWELAEDYDGLQQTLKKIEVTIHHIFREGNKLADYMANLAIDSNNKQSFNSFQQLPTMGKKIINTEKAQIPSLRVRTRRIQKPNTQRHQQR
ncbi:hypothetical protein R3W88_034223 [Solanum pinnatisectum]|uniref:RNase H type-1 domain-containing protein n=1 Tax=Solanum pinnatisectum TaxID=50273 RepID=A0AAV9JZ87_9SOLN|nr:hypothetical protein R3W88_034223 [Solanum pinnatisectum]